MLPKRVKACLPLYTSDHVLPIPGISDSIWLRQPLKSARLSTAFRALKYFESNTLRQGLLINSCAGPRNLRMAWGSIQEASTLYSLMHAFPKSQLLECGLFQIDPTSLPKAWGFKQGELPALGASPDGMFIHPSQPDMDSNILGTEVGRIWRSSPAMGSIPRCFSCSARQSGRGRNVHVPSRPYVPSRPCRPVTPRNTRMQAVASGIVSSSNDDDAS